MTLADYYLLDPRLELIPAEHLTPAGMSSEMAHLLQARRSWSRERLELFNRAISLYWERVSALARRTRTWAPPRLRHVAVVAEALAVRPYVQILNTSAWMIYESDLDPRLSNAELVAYLLVQADEMARRGEVSMAAVRSAAYWIERDPDERADFARAAAQSPRPDAAAFRDLAAALPWITKLHHEVLRPARPGTAVRSIPGTGLLVPKPLESEPPRLVEAWASAAAAAVDAFHRQWRSPDPGACSALCEWLAAEAPSLLLAEGKGNLVWEPGTATRTGSLRQRLKGAGGAAVRDIAADLHVVDAHTRRFLGGLRDPRGLPAAAAETEQRGYCYMHRERRLLAYNLSEPGLERLRGPQIPYARAMLGARALHEWAHLAADAGWIPATVAGAELERRTTALAGALDAAIAAAPRAARAQTAPDLSALAAASPQRSAGGALAAIFLQRIPDLQANLLAARFMDETERETYVRQNIRTLRGEYPPAQLWRMLVRYLYEYQYLQFSAMQNRRKFFLHSTWFDADFLDNGPLRPESLEELIAAATAIGDSYAVDESRFCFDKLATSSR